MSESRWLKPDFVGEMLASHSILGLAFAALIYVVCVSGTLAVFLSEIHRWEQPDHSFEAATISPEAVIRAADAALAKSEPQTSSLRILLPNADVPRTWISIGTLGAEVVEGVSQTWPVYKTGDLGLPYKVRFSEFGSPFTEFIRTLHNNLTIPGVLERVVGYPIVGIAGVGLLGLIISGLLSYPRIFRDAFTFRWGGSRLLQEADLHNRLAVWGLPFAIAMSLTGAVAGLFFGIQIPLVAVTLYQGDFGKVVESIYPNNPLFPSAAPETVNANPPLAEMSIASALDYVRNDPAVKAEPLFISISNAGTAHQTFNVVARVENSMIVAEQYYFDNAGRPSRAGNADGELGKQLFWSSFGLHFGRFGGLSVKALYFLLGAALSVVTASGVTIWLVRRRAKGRSAPNWERIWCTTVWAPLIAMSAAAIGALAADASPGVVFWVAFLGIYLLPVFVRNLRQLSLLLRTILAVCLGSTAIVHLVVNGDAAFWSLPLYFNGCLGLASLGLSIWCLREARQGVR